LFGVVGDKDESLMSLRFLFCVNPGCAAMTKSESRINDETSMALPPGGPLGAV